jgi:hypothetical protein
MLDPIMVKPINAKAVSAIECLIVGRKTGAD